MLKSGLALLLMRSTCVDQEAGDELERFRWVLEDVQGVGLLSWCVINSMLFLEQPLRLEMVFDCTMSNWLDKDSQKLTRF